MTNPPSNITIRLGDGVSMAYSSRCSADFAAGVEAHAPDRISASNAMPRDIYMDDDRRQAFHCGWAYAATLTEETA